MSNILDNPTGAITRSPDELPQARTMTEDEFVGWCVEEYGPQADGEEAASRGGPPGPNPPSRSHGTYILGYGTTSRIRSSSSATAVTEPRRATTGPVS